MLADMAIGIETSRLAVQRSAWEVDQVSGFAGVLAQRRLVFTSCLFVFSSLKHHSGSRGYCSEGIVLIVWIYQGILRTNIERNYGNH